MDLDIRSLINKIIPSRNTINDIKGIVVGILASIIGVIGLMGSYDLLTNIGGWGFLIGPFEFIVSIIIFVFGMSYILGNFRSLVRRFLR